MIPERLEISCPYCGEPTAVDPDPLVGRQEFWQDCEVCCQPILVQLECDADGIPARIDVRREDDA